MEKRRIRRKTRVNNNVLTESEGIQSQREWKDSWMLGLVYTLPIPALGRVGQKDHEFEASLGYALNVMPAWATETLSQKGTQEVMNLEQGRQLRNSLLSVVVVGEPFSSPGHSCDWSSMHCGTRAKGWLPGSCPLPGEAIESLDEVVCPWAILLRTLHQRHGGKDYIAGQEFMFEPKMNAESLHTHVLHPVKGGSNVAVTLNLSRSTNHPKAPHRSPRMWPMLRGWGGLKHPAPAANCPDLSSWLA